MSTPDLGADEGEFGVIEENAPSEAALIATSHNSLELSWTDNSQNEAGFYINISTDGSNFTPIRFVGEDVTTCSIGSLSPAARYWFRIYWAQIREGADTTLSQGFANTDGWTLPDSGGVIALHVTGGGFSTAEIDSIGVSRNPTNILYKVREDQSGWFVQANGLLGTTPMLAIASDWEGFAVTGLLRGAELSFHTIAVNSANADGAMSPATVLITNEYPFNGGPDQYGYTYVTSQSQNGPIFSWIDTTGFTLAPLTTSYELEWVDFQGFHFPFYGTSYTRAKFSTNGYLAFGDAQLSLSYINSALPAPVLAGSAIAILWDDLELRAGNRCYYRNFNDTLFVFTYPKANIEFRGDADTASFQILLHQDGRVCMQYRYCSNAVTATIGIQAAINGAANLQYGEPILATLSNWAIEFVPIQPLRLHASINGPDLILAWGQATNTIQGYRIYCSNDPYFTPGPTTLLATVPASQITYIDYNASAARNDRFYVVTSFTKE
ncbi:MAG: fibronectin type III domain-containing protein [bacterium]|nr:fibronectin type III domain-containing protein [bacterium]